MSCIVPNCQQIKQSSEKISLHLFPDPMRDPKRHLSWVKAINSERVLKFDPFVVFKRFRVCRNHFTKDCFNGECKKLLPNAIPTLYINQTKVKTKSFKDYEEKVLQMLRKNSVNIEEDSLKLISLDDMQILPEPIETEKLWNNIIEKEDNVADNFEEEFQLMEVENCENQAQYTIVMPPSENILTPKLPKILNYNRNTVKATSLIQEKPLIPPFNKIKLKQFQAAFNNDPRNLLAQNICSKMSVFEAASLAENAQYFNHEIDMKVTENIDNFHWCYTLFAIMKVSFMEKFNLAEFEFSQTHFMYHEKIERCYCYLNNFAKFLKSNDSKNERLMSLLLDDPLKDGGRWNIFASIINKYGVMPKEAYSGQVSKERVKDLNEILKTKLREYSKMLMNATSKNINISHIIDSKMNEICNIIAVCIGMPPETFSWNYPNGNNLLTPLEFYEQHVKPLFNVDEEFSLINDPRPSLKYQNLYTSENSDDIIDGNKMLSNNQPTEVLIDVITKSILNGEPVLAVCSLNGLSNFKLKNFHMLCDIKVNSSMEKSDRIELRDFAEKTAMIISGISTDSNENLVKLRFEQYKADKKVLFSIPKENFSEIVLEIVVDKKFLNNDLKSVYELNPIVLPAYDPLSNLFV